MTATLIAYAGAGIAAFITTLLLGMVARFIITRLPGAVRPASFGALCLMIGYALGRFRVEGNPADNGVGTLVQISGAAVAILILRRYWRMHPVAGDDRIRAE